MIVHRYIIFNYRYFNVDIFNGVFICSMNVKGSLQTIIHVLAWLLFTSLVVSFLSLSPAPGSFTNKLSEPALIIFLVFYLALFYGNNGYLFPILYLKKKYILYFTIMALLLIAVIYLKPFDHLMNDNHPGLGDHRGGPPPGSRGIDERRPGRGGQRFDIVSIILFVMVWSLSSVLQIFKQWRLSQEKVTKAEADKANAELSFLKAQVNPHFLFNTLNNIYALSVTNNPATSDAIMKLSQIMRYVTDEVTEDFVPLESEVECLTNYIELQKLRANKKTAISFSVIGDIEGKQIAPLILMTFVENVFKYGISNHEVSEIVIALEATGKQRIRFFCKNKLFADTAKLERTGIGITNTKKRLQYLYPNTHELSIVETADDFTVELTLDPYSF